MSTKGKAKSYIKLRGSLSIPYTIQGDSAYEVAVKNGFDGTEEEWLASLKGETGEPGKDGLNGKDGIDGKDGLDGKDGESVETDTSLSIEGAAADSKATGDRFKTIEEQIADILYEAITIKSFTNNVGTAEIGSTVTSVTLSWSFSKTPTTLTLDGESVATFLEGVAKKNLNLKANKTFTLKATDERDAVATRTTSISFLNGVYYGVSAIPATLDSAFVLTLTKELRSNKKPSFTANAGAGQYIYYCLPKRFGTCAFTVGGFTGGFTLVDTIAFTNASGYTEDYYIYRSDNAALGSTSVTVG